MDYYKAEVLSQQDYYPFGMMQPGRSYHAGLYAYGFNGKRMDNEIYGTGNFYDYGMRMYDPRVGKFFSVDPMTQSFPYLSPMSYAANNPIKFIDIDGLENVDPTIEQFYRNTPKINMANAPSGSSINAAGFKRNGRWFWRQMLNKHPEMFSRDNVVAIRSGRSPIVDKQWVQANPSQIDYMGDKLIHHHIEGGEMAAGIPEKVHFDYFEKLHPYLNSKGTSLKGAKIKGSLGDALNIVGFVGDIFSFFNGNPDSWLAMFPCVGCDPSDFIGKIQKNPNSGLYFTINSVTNKYENNKLISKTITYDIYNSFIWDEDSKKYRGINKEGTRTEVWDYDKNGKRTKVDLLESD